MQALVGRAGPAPPADTRPEANILFIIEAKRITLGPGYLKVEGTSPLVTFVDQSSDLVHTGESIFTLLTCITK